MSGFDSDWLALREPEDHRARNGDVARACARRFQALTTMTIVDIGCGAGSNLRALAPLLATRQSWRLIDHDARLIAAARASLQVWADEASDEGADLKLRKADKYLVVAFEERDLSGALDALWSPAPDLVTAAALFDLVSAPWITRFVAALAARKLPLLALLTYNGAESWTPPHPTDADMLAAFHAHQARDKGFGPAAGPLAAGALSAAFGAEAYALHAGASDWRLPAGAALTRATAEGVASAVRETGALAESAVADWLRARQNASARIGHEDLFAAPI